MSKDLSRVVEFISDHHVMSLATSDKDGELSICSLFYVYDDKSNTFIVASSPDTTHIKNIQTNPDVAFNILLETKEIGKIQGLQSSGTFLALEDSGLKKLYFLKYPYALAMNPKLWRIDVKKFKYTDNRLGFSKKIKIEF